VETSLVTMQLTAYDAKWIQAGESLSGSSGSNPFSFGFANNLLNEAFALFVLIWSQGLSGTCLLALLKGDNSNLERAVKLPLRKIRTGQIWFPRKLEF
jgi:hypothetical protein